MYGSQTLCIEGEICPSIARDIWVRFGDKQRMDMVRHVAERWDSQHMEATCGAPNIEDVGSISKLPPKGR